MGFSDPILKPLDDYLVPLKRYNSISGLLPSIDVTYSGTPYSVRPTGGGLLYVSMDEGCVAIDMGPRFLNALDMFANRCHSFDPSLSKINWTHMISVIVTHFHIDHWADFPYLVSLFYKRNINLKTISNSDMLTLYGSLETIRHLREIMESFAKYDPKGKPIKFGRYYVLSPTGTHFDATTKVGAHLKTFVLAGSDWSVTKTEHIEVRNRCTGIGLAIMLKNGRKVGITGDTAYSPAISREYRNTDLLVVNIGDFARTVGTFPLDQHMKLLGAKRFIQDVEPKLAVITEHDAKEAGDRIAVLKELNTSRTRVLSGDIGMTVRLSDLSMRCEGCGNFIMFEHISQAFVEEKETGDFAVQNFCETCIHKLGKKTV